MQKQQFEIHPAATLFPLMTEDEFQGLKDDISKYGLREDIVLWKNQLIDGRNRLRACEELGRNPQFAELDEDRDPWAYVISHNLHRRHLTTSQRGMIASKLATLKHGGDRKSEEIKVSNGTLIDDAAKQLNVGRMTVARAKTVQEHGSDEVIQAVETGALPVSTAAKLVKAEPDKKKQTAAVKNNTVKDVVKKTLPTVRKERRNGFEWKVTESDDYQRRIPVNVRNRDFIMVWIGYDDRMGVVKEMLSVMQPHELELVREWLNEFA